jgi:hypothetical protein
VFSKYLHPHPHPLHHHHPKPLHATSHSLHHISVVTRLTQSQQDKEKPMAAVPSLFLPRLFLIPRTLKPVLIQMLAKLVDLSFSFSLWLWLFLTLEHSERYRKRGVCELGKIQSFLCFLNF